MQLVETSAEAKIIDEIAKRLDISEDKYLQAEKRYKDLSLHLEKNLNQELNIYPQGSFMLGTVVRPYLKGRDADFDVDLVCEMAIDKSLTTPQEVKTKVGKALNEHPYDIILDEEGKRCWTLNYEETDRIGFHVDCLPCVQSAIGSDTKIALTHKESENNYKWRYSNPKALGNWFKERQKTAFEEIKLATKQKLFERRSIICNSIEEIPDRCVKTALQKSVQVLKRHRDIYFAGKQNENDKPISMIITILSAQLYKQEKNSFQALKNIINGLNEYSILLNSSEAIRAGFYNKNLISFDGNKWKISNPVLPEENFAEYWHENNHSKAKVFFEWINALNQDFVQIFESNDVDKIQPMLENRFKQKFDKDYLIKLGFNQIIKTETIRIIPARKVEVTNPIKPHCRNI